jgi:site-specific DNA-methyltransferase (adenine-specific)
MQIETIGNCVLYCGDCLEIMPMFEDGSVHSVITDLPYGTTYAPWDSVIPLDQLWLQYERIIRGRGALVFNASQPFTTTLIQSNLRWFKYEWIWDKHNPTNFANAKRQPLKQHENIVVFSRGQSPYYPIKTPGPPNHKQGKSKTNTSETRLISGRVDDDLSGMKYPKSILHFPKHSSQCGLHPTQKPLELISYLVRTYTQEGEVVLDNTMGSGTTGAACVKDNRKFIGIEKEQKYFDIACKRIEDALTI